MSKIPFFNFSTVPLLEPVFIFIFMPGCCMRNSSITLYKKPYSAVTVVPTYTVPLSAFTACITSSSPLLS